MLFHFHLPHLMLFHVTPWHSHPRANPKGLASDSGSPGGCDPCKGGLSQGCMAEPPMPCRTGLVQDIQSGNKGCRSISGRGESLLPLRTTGMLVSSIP